MPLGTRSLWVRVLVLFVLASMGLLHSGGGGEGIDEDGLAHGELVGVVLERLGLGEGSVRDLFEQPGARFLALELRSSSGGEDGDGRDGAEVQNLSGIL